MRQAWFPSRRVGSGVVALLLAVSTLALAPAPADAATIVSETFSYTGTVQTFTVPAGVAAITVTMAGGQGGRGGGDSQGSPTPGGYRGLVTGVIAVTPGQQMTVAVGGGGGTGVSSRGSAAGGAGGQNPLDGYDGASGGIAGPAGSSGGGGGSGAATVLQLNGTDIVAAGAGGNGGNGQFLAIVGRRAEDNHIARPDAVSTVGRAGMNTSLACSPGFNCDGGASGAGGGGAQGGEQGTVQYGGAAATEYFGFGGYPGANSTAAFANLTAGYEFYSGNNANGSVIISYDTGTPGAPTSVTGTPRSHEVALSWTAPSASGSADISDYVIEYATNAGGPYVVFVDGTSTVSATTVTGLTNGTTYFFRVAAVNSYGNGPNSSAMTIG
ncbi:MAG: fibronectin type III domain-containing protein, partial [Acidimicrobiales bacterium]